MFNYLYTITNFYNIIIQIYFYFLCVLFFLTILFLFVLLLFLFFLDFLLLPPIGLYPICFGGFDCLLRVTLRRVTGTTSSSSTSAPVGL